MEFLVNHPVLLLVVSFLFLWASTRGGAWLQIWHGQLNEERKGDFDIVLGATLTLLSLIVGFTFSMASSRYDQRKNLEEAEANAIGTAYARADLLPVRADADQVKQLLRGYTDLRIRFYTTVDARQIRDLDRDTLRVQRELWQRTVTATSAAPSAVTGLAAAAMNDALNAQGYAQAAKWNRIPLAAWVLMFVLGAISTAMIGHRFRIETRHYLLILIMPAVVSTAFFLIADIDCPGFGTIRVLPVNLIALVGTLG